MSVVYSPLCNTSEAAYFWYCLAQYGASIGISGAFDREGGDKGCDGRGGGSGECSGVVGCSGKCPWSAWLAVGGLRGPTCGVVGSGDRFVASGGSEPSVGRFSGGDVGNCDGGNVGGNGDDVSGGGSAVASGDKDEGLVGSDSAEAPEWRRGPGVSEKTLRNRRWRQERKELKLRRQSEGKDVRRVGVPRELSESWVARKNAENKLAALKAEKDLEYQMKRDVEAEARKSRARILKATEQDKVAVEKAFSTLKSTGNVPGYCETVLTKEPSLTEGETISPDSSISQAEVRAMHKENLDLKEKLRKKDRQIALLQFENGDECAFTINDEGTINDSVKEELGKFEKFGWLWEYSGDDSYGQDRAYTAFVRRKCVDRGDSAFA